MAHQCAGQWYLRSCDLGQSKDDQVGRLFCCGCTFSLNELFHVFYIGDLNFMLSCMFLPKCGSGVFDSEATGTLKVANTSFTSLMSANCCSKMPALRVLLENIDGMERILFE